MRFQSQYQERFLNTRGSQHQQVKQHSGCFENFGYRQHWKGLLSLWYLKVHQSLRDWHQTFQGSGISNPSWFPDCVCLFLSALVSAWYLHSSFQRPQYCVLGRLIWSLLRYRDENLPLDSVRTVGALQTNSHVPISILRGKVLMTGKAQTP